MESNHRPPPYQGGALPTELRERETCSCCLDLLQTLYGRSVERETGIEPALVAWKATVLPLNYSRKGNRHSLFRCRTNLEAGGGRWIRTTEGVSQQIYSLPPLAAWVSLRYHRTDQAWRPNQTRVKQPEILACADASVNAPDTFFSQTLNRKCRTSPSWTRYSLPSSRKIGRAHV